jgi:lipopolysaccharide biosynthesis regulator YciM
MTKKIIWRLREQPSTESLRKLVEDKILTKEEAREILFSSEEVKERDENSLKEEIKFLRELVEKLAKSRSEIITTIKEVEVPYKKCPWSEPYITWTYDIGSNSTYGNFIDIITW